MQQRKTTSLIERLIKHTIVKESGCWEWQGAKTDFGYGVIGRGIRGYGLVRAHRASWEIAYGEIPLGLIVRHRCDNPSCINPEHLLLGTHADNTRDKIERGRGDTAMSHAVIAEKTGWGTGVCFRGHVKTGKNTNKGRSYARCLICRKERRNLRAT